MQTIVLKVTLTFDPKALVQWAKDQKGVCCDEPAHDDPLGIYQYPELAVQSILGHAFLSVVPEEITNGGSVTTLDNGLPPELAQRIEDDYQEALRTVDDQREEQS